MAMNLRDRIRLLSSQDKLQSLVKLVNQGGKSAVIEGLYGASASLIISQLAHLSSRRFLVLVDDMRRARATASDLSFFLNVQRNAYADEEGAFLISDGSQADRRDDIFLLPSRSTQPFEMFSPPHNEMAARHLTLHAALTDKARIVVAPVEALLIRTAPRELIRDYVMNFAVFDKLDIDTVVTRLLETGYAREYVVELPGSFAVRGGILDVFPPNAELGVRFEMLDDTIESIRRFDPSTQRSIEKVQSALIPPASEVILTEQVARDAVAKLLSIKPHSDQYLNYQNVIQKMEQMSHFGGMENYLPLIYEKAPSPLDFFDDSYFTVMATSSPIDETISKFAREVKRSAEAANGTALFFCEEMLSGFVSEGELADSLKPRNKLYFVNESAIGGPAPDRHLAESFDRFSFETSPVRPAGSDVVLMLLSLFDRRADSRTDAVHIVCHTAEQARRMRRIMLSDDLGPSVDEDSDGPFGELCLADIYRDERAQLFVGRLSQGFRFPELGMTVVSEEELIGSKIASRKSRAKGAGDHMLDFSSLAAGDYVVHVDYGIGKYVGLSTMVVDGRPIDYMTVQYQGSDILYVPVEDLKGVQKYVASGDVVPKLDKMGGSAWAKAVTRVKKAAQEIAKELLELYAARSTIQGLIYSTDTPWQYQFELMFEYDETRDQLLAIEDVKRDMENAKPMDRLVCGDVGYGKTEVALRASFKAVNNGKQAAVLVPTTVLSQQHYDTFRKRFSQFPYKVEMLSRFRTRAEQKDVIEGLRDGTVHVVIGTHRLLSKDVEFFDLGLLIIDEEHRFGVRHKEKIKQLKKQVDVLTMTATPIPRTLHMALSDLRDISVIDTPPEDRLAIKTRIVRFDKELIREAIIREIGRGGQVYFVHNRVKSINAVAQMVKRLVPEARIAIGHGQMDEGELEDVMLRFVRNEYDVLVCTTIIESGLDIPYVNTIIINRADKFGLAQLYQLRGRVGRYKHQAYAYLMIPGIKTLSADARKRLAVINELTELGSGFRIATYDLQIRGSGNLLGQEQHGHMNTVGFHMYCELLKEAVHEMRGEPSEKKAAEPTFNLPINAFIPEAYIADSDQRLYMYRKLISSRDETAIDELRREILDRFGPMPEEVENLLILAALKLIARQVGLAMVSRRGAALYFEFREGSALRADDISLMFVQHERAISVVSERAAIVRTRYIEGETILEMLRFMLLSMRRLLSAA
ncbi:MAG: transcription-repair coupling factor [Candidatus Coatesbacteria bacterium]|nr:transcription-repair coupling factor [Candidatus Coatesbacteria bacterium]